MLVKTAVVIVISMATAVISFLKEDTGWTKRVGKSSKTLEISRRIRVISSLEIVF